MYEKNMDPRRGWGGGGTEEEGLVQIKLSSKYSEALINRGWVNLFRKITNIRRNCEKIKNKIRNENNFFNESLLDLNVDFVVIYILI